MIDHSRNMNLTLTSRNVGRFPFLTALQELCISTLHLEGSVFNSHCLDFISIVWFYVLEVTRVYREDSFRARFVSRTFLEFL